MPPPSDAVPPPAALSLPAEPLPADSLLGSLSASVEPLPLLALPDVVVEVVEVDVL